jgi:hypothetical protein
LLASGPGTGAAGLVGASSLQRHSRTLPTNTNNPSLEERRVANIGRIIKDGLKALVAWMVISAVLVYFFRYPGWIISQLVGLIFLGLFVALRAAELLFWVLGFLGFARGGPSRAAPPVTSGPTSPQGSASRTCSTCNGTGQMSCPVCRGMRGQTEQGTGSWLPCPYCVSNGAVQCTSCSGVGHFPS